MSHLLQSSNSSIQKSRRNQLTKRNLKRDAKLFNKNSTSCDSLKHKPKKDVVMGWNLEDYNNHRRQILEAKAVVDDTPPRISIGQIFKTKVIVDEANKLNNIHQNNKKLLQRINVINRTTGCVDCWNKIVKYDTMTNLGSRLAEAKNITRNNLSLYLRLKDASSMYRQEILLKDWERIERAMQRMSRFPLQWKIKKDKKCEEWNFSIKDLDTTFGGSSFVKTPTPPEIKCFMEFMAGDEYLGKIVIKLYNEIVPLTVRNFMYYCQNKEEKQKGKSAETEIGGILTYEGCPVHRIVPGYYFQTGDIIAGNGSDGVSLYGPVFDDENFILTHSLPGVLSMANTGPDTNNSQFMVTFQKLEPLDGQQVVFGRVVQGIKTLKKIEYFGTKKGRPLSKVIISNCGILQQ